MWSLLVGLLVTSTIFGGWWVAQRLQGDREDQIRSEDRADPSLDFDEPWRPSGTYIVENGRAYAQAAIALPPAVEVVLPEDREGLSIVTQANAPAEKVSVLIETRVGLFHHPGHVLRLRDLRSDKKLWKKQVGATLVIDLDGGVSHMEGGVWVRGLVRVPPGTLVRREASSTANIAGREEVPQQPLPKSEWPLPAERSAQLPK